MVPVAELLEVPADEREGRFPYIWGVDGKNRLMRLLVTEDMVRSAEERLAFWRQLKDVAGLGARAAGDAEAVAERVRAELIQKITASLGVSGSDLPAVPAAGPAVAPAANQAANADKPSAAPSVIMCPASAIRASDPARQPAMSSTTEKPSVRIKAVPKVFPTAP